MESITPIEWKGVPCLYVIQYQEGYEIISADKRSQIPLAFNDKGKLELDQDLDGFRGHLDLMAEEIWFALNGYGDWSGTEWESEVEWSLAFWRMVNADESLFNQNRDQSEDQGRFLDPNPPMGHWVLVEAYTEEVPYDSIPHLTATQWYQTNGYNAYCPEDRDTLNIIDRCPAGCVAIAGAQMLYFLHGKHGVPTSSPASGYCTGYVYNNTVSQGFYNPSPSTWGYMSCPRPNYGPADDYSALLIGDVGKKVGMQYHWNGSSASTYNLISTVFNQYGWNCSYMNSNNSSTIVSNLLAGYPVVCAGNISSTVGHSFLIDSYMRCRTRVTSVYVWVYDNLPPGSYPLQYWRETLYDETIPIHVAYYRMNWGQENTSINDTWCALDGIWQMGNNPPYTYSQSILYDFVML